MPVQTLWYTSPSVLHSIDAPQCIFPYNNTSFRPPSSTPCSYHYWIASRNSGRFWADSVEDSVEALTLPLIPNIIRKPGGLPCVQQAPPQRSSEEVGTHSPVSQPQTLLDARCIDRHHSQPSHTQAHGRIDRHLQPLGRRSPPYEVTYRAIPPTRRPPEAARGP